MPEKKVKVSKSVPFRDQYGNIIVRKAHIRSLEKTEKRKPKLYKIILPDGTVYTKRSVHDYKFATIEYGAGTTAWDEEMNPIYSNFRWKVNLHTSKESAERSISVIKKFQSEGAWEDIKEYKIIELD